MAALRATMSSLLEAVVGMISEVRIRGFQRHNNPRCYRTDRLGVGHALGDSGDAPTPAVMCREW
jgi:hypothetical protein